jgi:hypothetical protein
MKTAMFVVLSLALAFVSGCSHMQCKESLVFSVSTEVPQSKDCLGQPVVLKIEYRLEDPLLAAARNAVSETKKGTDAK